MSDALALEIRAALLRFARAREKTFCPSEVARSLRTSWRPLMHPVRNEAQRLVDEGKLRCTQKGLAVSPAKARGPIRLSGA